jgi:hypothetical protein
VADSAVPGVNVGQDTGLIASLVCLSARMTSPAVMLCNRRESRGCHVGIVKHAVPDRRRTI